MECPIDCEVDGQTRSKCNGRISICYAGDIVIIILSEEHLQQILDSITNWCNTWRLWVNQDKSNVDIMCILEEVSHI